jgi:hypothetical protein
MAWLQADADSLRSAIISLATGARVATVSYAGPPARSVTYAAADLPAIEALLARIERSLLLTSGYRRVSFSKGFDTGSGGK